MDDIIFNCGSNIFIFVFAHHYTCLKIILILISSKTCKNAMWKPYLYPVTVIIKYCSDFRGSYSWDSLLCIIRFFSKIFQNVPVFPATIIHNHYVHTQHNMEDSTGNQSQNTESYNTSDDSRNALNNSLKSTVSILFIGPRGLHGTGPGPRLHPTWPGPAHERCFFP